MKKTTVAVIGTKGCAKEFIQSVAAHGRKTKVLDHIPLRDLPEILDDLEGLIPDSVFKADVVLDYSGHPDIPYALESARRVITYSKISLPNTLHVDCFCSVDITEEFGIPVFNISVEDGKITGMKVVKSSPCGAAYNLVKKLVDMPVEEAISKSALLTQFTCKGSGGPEGSIHKAAEIHRAAIKKAVSIQ